MDLKINSRLIIFSAVILCLCFSVKLLGQSTKITSKNNAKTIKYPYKFKYKGNPLVSYRSSTDPDVHVWDNEVWMYCSQDHQKAPGVKTNYDGMDGYHAFSTKDMKNWTDHGEVMH